MSLADDHRQKEEIEALKAIYENDFIESTGAASLNEFTLRIPHASPVIANKFLVHLRVILPKTYPSKANPTLRIVKPVEGLTPTDIEELGDVLRREMQTLKGMEMLFQLATMCQEWIVEKYPESKHAPATGSLAVEMNTRASEQEKAKRIEQDDLMRAQQEREEQAAALFAMEIKDTAERKEAKQRLEKAQMKQRNRAYSDVTELTQVGHPLLETFEDGIVINETLTLKTINIFQPRRSFLGTKYTAEAVTEESDVPPLELHVVHFDSHYYTDNPGWRKLQDVEADLKKLIQIRHPNVQEIYACKLTRKVGHVLPKLYILSEPEPTFTLKDMLDACGTLSPDKIVEYLRQVLGGLSALHDHGLVHRCLTTSNLGLSRSIVPNIKPRVKVFGTSYISRIAGLNRSNPFGSVVRTEPPWPESWLSRDMLQSPLLFTPARDIHHLAIITFEMHCGLDITLSRPSAASALHLISESLRGIVEDMVGAKKNTGCQDLLRTLSQLPQSGAKTKARTEDSGGADPSVYSRLYEQVSPIHRDLPLGTRLGSRYRTDWDELEFLGSGGFGEVVKARNKLDGRIYAVKKIRLRPSDNDAKIFREVTALARLSHRSIVRYYTTWIEISDGLDSSSPSNTDSGSISEPDIDDTVRSNSRSVDIFQLDLNELTSGSGRNDSFPGIYFTDRSQISTDDGDQSDGDSICGSPLTATTRVKTRLPASTMYIQMEYVENLTLKEKIASGIDEDEAWRLFHQLLDALIHMSNLGILHRDIKLGNIFIDMNGDCKIGDFGLATSSIAAVEPSVTTAPLRAVDSDMTMDIGTRLYVAPELLKNSRSSGPRNHSKADMYSLGIVFFEMNFTFRTGAERIAVIEKLRFSAIEFPPSWEAHRRNQKEIISLLLLHDVNLRPSASELSQNPLLPARVEDESLEGALRMMAKPDSPHYSTVLSLLFNQKPNIARAVLYDSNLGRQEHVALDSVIEEHVYHLSRLHGAVRIEPPILVPATSKSQAEDSNSFLLLDKQGDLVTFSRNLLVPFARMAARTNLKRIKRCYVGNVYRSPPGGGHPSSVKAAIFDIITPSITEGVEAAAAECISIVSELMDRFPGLTSPPYEFRISHASIAEWVLSRIDGTLRAEAMDILIQVKSTFSQKRTALVQCGLARTLVDEIEALTTAVGSVDDAIARFARAAPANLPHIVPYLEAIRRTIHFATAMGLSKMITIQPMHVGQHQFKEGVVFEVTKGPRRTDVLAAGGRYDHLLTEFSMAHADNEPVRAVGMQIALDKIAASLAHFQSLNVRTLVKEQRSFGFWSPRRCDVYIISHSLGQEYERLETAHHLWSNGISADVMYESALHDGVESVHSLCLKEGILFTVFPRPRVSRSGMPGFKVTSTLTRTEHEVSRPELISFLHQRLAEQQRVDASTAGVEAAPNTPMGVPRDSSLTADAADVQLVLPPDRKQLKHNKNILLDKAYEMATQAQTAFLTGIPVVAVHVPAAAFAAMTENQAWLCDNEPEALKNVLATFPPPPSYASQIREALIKRKTDGHRFVLLVSLRDERIHLITLP